MSVVGLGSPIEPDGTDGSGDACPRVVAGASVSCGGGSAVGISSSVLEDDELDDELEEEDDSLLSGVPPDAGTCSASGSSAVVIRLIGCSAPATTR